MYLIQESLENNCMGQDAELGIELEESTSQVKTEDSAVKAASSSSSSASAVLESLSTCSSSKKDAKNVKKQRRTTKKAPDAPKKFKSAYICFLMDKMSGTKKGDNPDIKMSDMMKVFASTWKELPQAERLKFEKIAEADKKRYFTEISNYTGPMTVPNKRQKKPLDAPKRGISAFLSFSQENRPHIRSEQPGMKTTDLTRLLAQQWNSANEEQKRPHFDRELREREKYYEEMAKWKEQGNMQQDEKIVPGSSASPSLDDAWRAASNSMIDLGGGDVKMEDNLLSSRLSYVEGGSSSDTLTKLAGNGASSSSDRSMSGNGRPNTTHHDFYDNGCGNDSGSQISAATTNESKSCGANKAGYGAAQVGGDSAAKRGSNSLSKGKKLQRTKSNEKDKGAPTAMMQSSGDRALYFVNKKDQSVTDAFQRINQSAINELNDDDYLASLSSLVTSTYSFYSSPQQASSTLAMSNAFDKWDNIEQNDTSTQLPNYANNSSSNTSNTNNQYGIANSLYLNPSYYQQPAAGPSAIQGRSTGFAPLQSIGTYQSLVAQQQSQQEDNFVVGQNMVDNAEGQMYQVVDGSCEVFDTSVDEKQMQRNGALAMENGRFSGSSSSGGSSSSTSSGNTDSEKFSGSSSSGQSISGDRSSGNQWEYSSCKSLAYQNGSIGQLQQNGNFSQSDFYNFVSKVFDSSDDLANLRLETEASSN